MEPQKPFVCVNPDCGMTFTNEDRLLVHSQKHEMRLQLGPEQKAAFVADQTPTPTRFIRNCEEVGLFQDLQNVNPFDEGFKRAMEAKSGILSLDNAMVSTSDDVLHTPQMVFPNLADTADSTMFSSTNNQRNITISRSSSDESGAIKEYETTTISKLTNEVTTISRIIGKQDTVDKTNTSDDVASSKDILNETVSYTNNIIKIHSNVEIRKDSHTNNDTVKQSTYSDSIIKDSSIFLTKDVMLTDPDKLQVPEKLPPIMSQKSIDFVVDSLTTESECHEENENVKKMKESPLVKILRSNYGNSLRKCKSPATDTGCPGESVIKISDAHKDKNSKKLRNCKRKVSIMEPMHKKSDDYEVIIKLPNQTYIRMKAVEELTEESAGKDAAQVQEETKERLKSILKNKAVKVPQSVSVKPVSHIIPSSLPIPGGTLYPVTIVNPPAASILLKSSVNKVPIPVDNMFAKLPGTRKSVKRKMDTCSGKHLAEHNYLQNTTTKSGSHYIDPIEDCKNTPNKGSSTINTGSSLVYENCNTITSSANNTTISGAVTRQKIDESTLSQDSLRRRSAASRRYRQRLKLTMKSQKLENMQLKDQNQRLMIENGALKELIIEHVQQCPNPGKLRNTHLFVQPGECVKRRTSATPST